MTGIPECMTRRPTDSEYTAACARLDAAGADPWQYGTGIWIVAAAALLDATERAERAEAEAEALRKVVAAGDVLADAVERGEPQHTIDRALAAYRAATAKTAPVPVVHLSTGCDESLYGPPVFSTACDGHYWADSERITERHAAVTCKACRRTRAFEEQST